MFQPLSCRARLYLLARAHAPRRRFHRAYLTATPVFSNSLIRASRACWRWSTTSEFTAALIKSGRTNRSSLIASFNFARSSRTRCWRPLALMSSPTRRLVSRASSSCSRLSRGACSGPRSAGSADFLDSL